ncbi:MAG: Rpn family recombination-promoting nuclease/putative transposase, partial [Oscillospiraceae bacterium]|nr:Rpn family recombination-promoting nuclease/putative transposase [Oscillospiraceae bacterium]
MKIEDILIKPDEDLLDPKDDAVFKFLFTSENEYSRGALKSLISELTGHEVKELRISMNEPPVEFVGDKQIRFDVNCLFNDGQRANVEMCMYPNENEAGRSELFAARLFLTQETKGKKYNEIADAYQISIIDKKELTNDDSVLHVYEFYDSENKVSLGGKIHIIHIELKKYDRLEKTTKNMDGKERWGAYLKWIKNKEKIDLVNE